MPEKSNKTVTSDALNQEPAGSKPSVSCIEAEVLHLSEADQYRFAQSLLSPPSPSPALCRAFTRRATLLDSQP